MGAAKRDDNREVALIAQNLLGTQPLFITGLSLTNATPLHVAMVDGNGDQIVSFGGGTQYTDAGVPPAHPVGNTIEWSDGSNWQTVSTAKPLPVSGSFSLTNPTVGSAVPATANYIAGNKGGNLTGLLIGSQTTANSLAVALASDQAAIPVTGTFWQSTQPVSLASVPSHAVTNAGTFAVQPTAAATGGYTPGKLISGASTNGTNIKGSAGTLGYITASNINAAVRYLKIYNKATTPSVGTDVPVHTFLIPGNTAGAGFMLPLPPQGIALGTGIGIGITTGVADNDTGAVAASDIVINYGFN